MKILALLGALALLAGCVSYDPQANAKRLCKTAPELPYAQCVEDVYEAGLAAVPEPQPDSAPERRSITCHTARDFPGSRILTSSTTTCD